MDVKYITPFIDATIDVFKDFFAIEPEVKNPYWVEQEIAHQWELSAIIGIAGESRGCVILSFTESLAEKLTSRLIGRDVDLLDDDVVDTIGEVVNIVAGNAKKGLEQYRLMISLPSVIRGKNHKVSCPGGKNAPLIGIPLHTEQGIAHLSIGLENIIER